jgi:TPR repeat protein
MRISKIALWFGAAIAGMVVLSMFAVGFVEGFQAVGDAAAAERGYETRASIDHDIALCEQGVTDRCLHAAKHLGDPAEPYNDQPRAFAAFERACNARFADGCANMGVMIDGGWVGARDPERVRHLYESSCVAGSVLGCGALSRALTTGSLGTVDEPRSIVLGRRACDLGDTRSCVAIAQRMAFGAGMPRDVAGAMALFDRQCDFGDPNACNEGGMMLLRPAERDQMMNDLRRSNEFFDRGCQLGDESGCRSAASNRTRLAELAAMP